MRTSRTPALGALAALTATALLALTGCGGAGDDSGDSSAARSSTPSTAASSPSASPSVDTQLIGVGAQGVGIAVGAYSVKHDFAIPTDQADFEAKVTYDQGADAVDLPAGSKVGYRKTGARRYEVCVVQYDGSTPVGWGLFDSVSGTETDGAGAPTSRTCP